MATPAAGQVAAADAATMASDIETYFPGTFVDRAVANSIAELLGSGDLLSGEMWKPVDLGPGFALASSPDAMTPGVVHLALAKALVPAVEPTIAPAVPSIEPPAPVSPEIVATLERKTDQLTDQLGRANLLLNTVLVVSIFALLAIVALAWLLRGRPPGAKSGEAVALRDIRSDLEKIDLQLKALTETTSQRRSVASAPDVAAIETRLDALSKVMATSQAMDVIQRYVESFGEDLMRFQTAVLGAAGSQDGVPLLGQLVKLDRAVEELQRRPSSPDTNAVSATVTAAILAGLTIRDQQTTEQLSRLEGQVQALPTSAKLSEELGRLAGTEQRLSSQLASLSAELAVATGFINEQRQALYSQQERLSEQVTALQAASDSQRETIGNRQQELEEFTTWLGGSGTPAAAALGRSGEIRDLILGLAPLLALDDTAILSLARTPDRALVVQALRVENLLAALRRFRESLFGLDDGQALKKALVGGFEQGWLHNLLRAELILTTYMKGESAYQPLADWYVRTAATLRQALDTANIHSGQVRLLELPIGNFEAGYDVVPALTKIESIGTKVAERRGQGIGFTVDVERFPYDVDDRVIGAKVVLYNPAAW